MASKRIFFEKGKPVHVISRALTNIFREPADCYRLIFQFYATNLGKPGFNISAKDAMKSGQALLHGEELPKRFVIKEHPPLVDLLDFSEVINHGHFYLIPNIDNILPIFMQRFNGGFAKYFNLAHNRRDAVFGSRYKGIVVTTDRQSYTVSRYVSIINPLDVFQAGWREKGLKNPNEAFNFLKNYEFSSFPDRVGARKSKILAPKEVLEKYTFQTNSHKGKTEFCEFVKEFLKERSSLSAQLFLE